MEIASSTKNDRIRSQNLKNQAIVNQAKAKSNSLLTLRAIKKHLPNRFIFARIKTKRLKKQQCKQHVSDCKSTKIRNLLQAPEILTLKRCNSKTQFRRILLKLNPEWKKVIKFYMTECFIHDLYTRRLENKMFLMSKRDLLYRLVDNPELLTKDCHFDNNLLKNYCTGIANFVARHYKDIQSKLKIQL